MRRTPVYSHPIPDILIFRKVILMLLALSVAALVLYSVMHVRNGDAQDQQLRQLAAKMEATRFMKQDDYYRLHTLFSQTASSGSISDQDLNWLLILMHTPTMRQNNIDLVQSEVLSVFQNLTRATPSQKDKIILATAPFLSAEDPYDLNTGLLKKSAADVLGVMGDKKSAQYLLPVLNDPRPKVVKHARKALQALGYGSAGRA